MSALGHLPRRTHARLAAAAAVLLVVLLGTAPAWASTWSVTVDGPLPVGWVADPGQQQVWKAAGYESWVWSFNDVRDPARPDRSVRASVEVLRFTSNGKVSIVDELIRDVALQDMALRDVNVLESGETTFKGFRALYAKATIDTQSGLSGTPEADATAYEEHWYLFLPDGSGLRIDGRARVPAEIASELDSVRAQMIDVVARLQIDEGAAASPADDPLPWKTVAAGAAAVAAAASALAGAAASRLSRKAKVDPNVPVGYVLQLSTDRLAVGSSVQSELTATVWRVLASGATESAEGAIVTLHPPAGVAVSPSTGPSPFTAGVWQTGDVAAGKAGAFLGVHAVAAGGATTTTIGLDVEEANRLTLVVEPAVDAIRPNGSHVVTAVATLEPSASLAAAADFDAGAAQRAITFTVAPPAWVDRGTEHDVPGGRALPIAVSQPNADAPVEPPDTVVVRATVQLPGRVLTESLTLAVERPPRIDARPDRVRFAISTKARADVLVWVEPADQQAWAFTAAWRAGDRPIATSSVRSDAPGTAVVTLTEDAASLPPSGAPTETSTLVVTGRHPDWGAIERHLLVEVVAEGLYVDDVGRDRDGTFHLLADGSGTPTDIDIRVFTRSATGDRIELDPDLSRSIAFNVISEQTTPAGAAWRYGGVEHVDGGIRPSNSPSAVHRFTIPRRLPTAGEPLVVRLTATSPAGPADLFSKPLTVSIVGVNTAPYSKAWEVERDNCLHVIDEFVPAEHRARLTALVHERGRTLGAEGLHELRRQLWDFAYGQTMKEAHDHLTAAWWAQQVEDTLDWVSWCGDIAMGVATGALAGTAASVGVGLLKPSLVAAMQVWVDGGSVSDWAYGQVRVFAGAVEGAATDVDAIDKLAGNKAIAWSVFIAYTFVREVASDPNLSVTDAMTRIAQQLRDEGLIQFLRFAAARAGAKPGAHAPGAEPDAKKPKGDEPASGKKQTDGDGEEPPRGDHRPPVDTRAVKQLAERVKYRNGKAYADPRDVVAVMGDPEATRSLKNHSDPAIRDAFENTRQEIYAEHDRKLKEYVRGLPGMDGKEIVIEEIRTPGKEKDFNTDRDYRVLVKTIDPETGRTIMVEVPATKWAQQSQQIFAGETGGPTDPTGASAWAEQHQQLATDRRHAEAAPDMSDQQMWVYDQHGNLVQTTGEPRIAAVKDGRGVLIDPETLGDVYEHKVVEQLNHEHPGEAFAQAGKAVRDLNEIRAGYAKQGYGIGSLSEPMQRGMAIVTDAGARAFDDSRAIAAADAALRDAGFPGGLRSFMGALSTQVEALKYARK